MAAVVHRARAALAAGSLVLAGCSGGGVGGEDAGADGAGPDGGGAASPGYDAVWAEFLDPPGVRDELDLLASRSLALNFAWPSSAVRDPDYLGLVADARAQGVELRPWLLLEQSEGYWPGATNAVPFAAAARALFDAWEAEGLEPTTFIVDMEIEFERAMRVNALLSDPNADVGELLATFQEGVDAERYAAATAEFATLVDDAHARGWRVLLTTLPQVVDDYEDGDDGIRQAFGIPVDGIAWDVVTFQAYRTLFGDLLSGSAVEAGTGAGPTSYFVYDYGRSALEHFGDRGGLDLGLVGQGVSESPVYPGPGDLLADVEAAHAAGIPPDRINVFGLDGMLERGPAEDWMREPAAAPTAPPVDPATESQREVIRSLDGVFP